MRENGEPLRVLLQSDPRAHPAIAMCLRRFGRNALQYAASRDIRIVPLPLTDRYAQHSSALRRLCVDVDAWPAPPAGLFVVEERTVYLRSHSPMTVAHEFGHALDCALGNGVYRSAADSYVQSLFAGAASYVTPYAATAVDEYFAESLRAFVEVNDAASFWPRVSRPRLRRIDPAMHDYIERIFSAEFVR